MWKFLWWSCSYLFSGGVAALEGGEWLAARFGSTLPPGKNRHTFYRRLGGLQGRSGRAENLVPIGIRSRTVQPVVSRYTDWATGPKSIFHICIFKLGFSFLLCFVLWHWMILKTFWYRAMVLPSIYPQQISISIRFIFAPVNEFRTPHISSMSVLPKATAPKPSNWLKHSGLWLVLGEVSGWTWFESQQG